MANQEPGRLPQLEVLGKHEPWPVDPNWVATVRQQLRDWADDPKTLKAGAFRDFTQSTPAVVWYLHQVAPHLGGYIPVLAGDYADISAELTNDFYRPSWRLAGNGHLIRRTATDWPLKLLSGTRNFPEKRRRRAVELSRDVMALFVEVPPFAERARVLAGIFERALSDQDHVDLHCTTPYPEIAKVWRTEFLRDPERQVLPELAGPGPALAACLEILGQAHEDLLQRHGDGAEPFPAAVASLALASGVSELPAQASRSLGEHAAAAEKSFQQRREDFRAADWLAANAAWLAHALAGGAMQLSRVWAATAAQVSVQFAGTLNNAPWPRPEVPDLGALFAILAGIRTGDERPTKQASLASLVRKQWAGTGEVQTPAKPAAAPAKTAEVPAKTADAGDADPTDLIGQALAQAELDKQAPVHLGEATAEDGELPEPLVFDDPMAELDSLIGLESVKNAVRRVVAETKADLRRKELGLPTSERARHMVFVGKPGTAKTTIARLLSRIYKDLGVLKKGHVVECDRAELVGAGVGTTAPMTAEKFRQALGGVLFVDEAYSLVPEDSPGDFGLEAVATILKMMEDHRDDCIVICAGYHREMQRFLESNTGLTSRFPKILAFSDYNDEQLLAIFELQARQKGLILAEGVLEAVYEVIPRPPRSHTFGNGRFMRNVMEETVVNQADRLSKLEVEPTEAQLREILPEDISAPTSMRAEDYLLDKEGG